MRSRETIIRLHRFKADEARRKLVLLEGMKADLECKSSELERTVASEQRRAIEDEIGRFAYPGFARSVVTRRENLDKSLGEIERQIAAVREELNDAYSELKKFETIEENRQREAQAARAQEEQAEADDITLTRFAGRAESRT